VFSGDELLTRVTASSVTGTSFAPYAKRSPREQLELFVAGVRTALALG
jgi:hypothetical protein